LEGGAAFATGVKDAFYFLCWCRTSTTLFSIIKTRIALSAIILWDVFKEIALLACQKPSTAERYNIPGIPGLCIRSVESAAIC
jgi:hypothetical protein